jgi:Tol biopolymer transport system component
VTAIYVVGITGGEAMQLAVGAQPAPSPIDDRVAFVTPPDAAGARRVMLTDLAHGEPRPVEGLEAAGWQRPVFSADGTRLLLMRGYQQVVIATLDRSAPPATVWSSADTAVSMLAWAPDGGVIASIADYEGDVWLAEGAFP